MSENTAPESTVTEPAQHPAGHSPITDASPAHAASGPEPTYSTAGVEQPDEVEPEVDYFGVVRSLKAGEKLQLMAKLSVTEQQLNVTGVAQLMAVAWKHRKVTTGQPKIIDLLDKTDTELLDVIGLTDEQYVEQVKAFAATKSDDD